MKYVTGQVVTCDACNGSGSIDFREYELTPDEKATEMYRRRVRALEQLGAAVLDQYDAALRQGTVNFVPPALEKLRSALGVRLGGS